MATFTVTNVERHPDGTPWRTARVKVTLAGPAIDSSGAELVGTLWAVTDVNGAVSVPGLQVGVPYVWTAPDGTRTFFQAGGSGSFAMPALAVVYVPPGSAAVTPGELAAALLGMAEADLSNVTPATGRSALGLGSASTHPATDFDASGAAAAVAAQLSNYASLDGSSRLAIGGTEITPAQVGAVSKSTAQGVALVQALIFGS